MSNGYLATLDIGSSQVRVCVAELTKNGTFPIVGVGTAMSSGIKKGAIIDIEQAAGAIRSAIEQAEQMVGIEITNVYVGLSGNHISIQHSHGVVATLNQDREIGAEDVERVLQASKVIALPPERVIIEVVSKQFIVDGIPEIRDPIGMVGVRLEVEAMIITGSKTVVHNVYRCIEKASLHMAGFVFLPLSISEFTLTADEKMLGVVLADIGSGTIKLAFYAQGNLAGTAVIPMGGEYITTDLVYVLQTQKEVAEELKCKHGIAVKAHADKRESIPIQMMAGKERYSSQLELAQIMEPRIMEIFQLINQQVKAMGFSHEPAGGYVLVGGVTETPYLLDAAKSQLGQGVRIARSKETAISSPAFLASVSMIHHLAKQGSVLINKPARVETVPRKKEKKQVSAFQRMKSWLSEFI
jgi:cell division protein FtsA